MGALVGRAGTGQELSALSVRRSGADAAASVRCPSGFALPPDERGMLERLVAGVERALLGFSESPVESIPEALVQLSSLQLRLASLQAQAAAVETGLAMRMIGRTSGSTSNATPATDTSHRVAEPRNDESSARGGSMSGARFVRINDLSVKTGLKISRIRYLRLTNQIPCHKIGSSVLFDVLEIEKWLAAQRAVTVDEAIKESR